MKMHNSTCRIAIFSLCAAALNLVSAAADAAGPPEKPPLFAQLLGGNEISVLGIANSGDPDGVGAATVMIRGTNTLCYAIVVNNLGTPTGAHIHKQRAGQNGGIVVTLTPPAQGGAGTTSKCITVNDSALLADIRSNPSGYYVNVHTSLFPNGAIRGQLF